MAYQYYPGGKNEDKKPGCTTAGAAGGGDAPYMSALIGQSEKRTTFPTEGARAATLFGGGGGAGGDSGNGGNIASTSKGVVDAIRFNETQTQFHAAEVGAGFSANGVVPNIPDASLQLNYATCAALGAQQNSPRFSTKVFVGGLPPDIEEDEIVNAFRRFGSLCVDWPHKTEMMSYHPPKGFAFLLFHDEKSVQLLIDRCGAENGKLFFCISSQTIRNKLVQVRPWRLVDSGYVLDPDVARDARKTVFIGGVPRPLKAFELAIIMNRMYGNVCFASIDTDAEHKYPKGAGRVCFTTTHSYISAISARFIQLQFGDIDKRVEVKPYVLDDQICDECNGQYTPGKYAPFFCANVSCVRYYCEHCWTLVHMLPGRECHKPTTRPRGMPMLWN